MHETKNLKLLNKIENLEGLTRLYFKDADNKEYSLNVQDIKYNNITISPITILCKIYDVDSIDKITFVRGCFIGDTLKNIGHIINDDWLLSIIHSINRYQSYFKYITDLSNNKITVTDINTKNETITSDDEIEIVTLFERNIYHIYKDKLVLQINRQKPQIGPEIVYLELDKNILKMLQTAEWRFAADKSGTKLYIPGENYPNKTNPGKHGGRAQMNLCEYCYGCKPRYVKFEKIKEDYYIVKSSRKPLNEKEFNKKLKLIEESKLKNE